MKVIFSSPFGPLQACKIISTQKLVYKETRNYPTFQGRFCQEFRWVFLHILYHFLCNIDDTYQIWPLLASRLNCIFCFLHNQHLFTLNPLLSPLGSLFFQALLRGGGVFNLAKRINTNKVSRGRTCGSWALYCFF